MIKRRSRTRLLVEKALWQLISRMTMGAGEQNWLGNPVIPKLLDLTPDQFKKPVALRILAFSTHYFRQSRWSETLHPHAKSGAEFLQAEYEWNMNYRKSIAINVLQKYINSSHTVLDFGCGPGLTCYAISGMAMSVIGVDISAGAIACAKVLNWSTNVNYLVINGTDLSCIDSQNVDTVISFAVFQHLSDELMHIFLKEFFRLLRNGGCCVIHVALAEDRQAKLPSATPALVVFLKKNRLLNSFFPAVRMTYRSRADMISAVESAGFETPMFISMVDLVSIDGDLGHQHLMVFNKP